MGILVLECEKLHWPELPLHSGLIEDFFSE
jgi:hypothetical protein